MTDRPGHQGHVTQRARGSRPRPSAASSPGRAPSTPQTQGKGLAPAPPGKCSPLGRLSCCDGDLSGTGPASTRLLLTPTDGAQGPAPQAASTRPPLGLRGAGGSLGAGGVTASAMPAHVTVCRAGVGRSERLRGGVSVKRKSELRSWQTASPGSLPGQVWDRDCPDPPPRSAGPGCDHRGTRA